MSQDSGHVRHELSEYLDSLLPEQEHHRVAEHIKGCQDCEQLFQQLVHLRILLHEQPLVPLPDEFYSTVIKKIKRKESPFPKFELSVQFRVLLVLCAVMGFVWWRLGDMMKVDSPKVIVPPPVINNAPEPPTVSTVTPDVVTTEDSTAQPEIPSPSTFTVVSLSTTPAQKIAPRVVKPVAKPKRKVATKTVEKSATTVTSSIKPAENLVLKPTKSVQKPKLVEFHTESDIVPSELVEWKGTDSGVRKFRTYVISTPAQMRDLWNKHSPKTPMPVVDFDRFQVVGITSGQTHNAASGFEIMGTRTSVDALIVYYREAKNMFRSQASIASFRPYHFKVIPRSKLPIKFQQI